MATSLLVPLDGSVTAEHAIPYAQALLPDGGEIRLVGVIQDLDRQFVEMLGTSEPTGGEAIDAIVRRELEQVATRFPNPRIQWVTDVERGDVAEQILHTIGRTNVDMVVMTTRGLGAVGRTAFGSVADRVARTSPVPVLLVRPPADETELPAAAVRRLVVLLDGSELAEAALPLASEMASRLRVPIHLMRAIDLASSLAPVIGRGFAIAAVSPEMYNETLEAVQRDASDYLETTAAQLTQAGLSVSWTLMEGSPFFAIPQAVAPDDLIVMTSHGRGGVMRWLLGSVAEKLVREAPAPVVLVPSPGRGSHAAQMAATGIDVEQSG